NSISNNKIYALKAYGPYNADASVTGIQVNHHPFLQSDTGEVSISMNHIYSLEYVTNVKQYAVYSYGIWALGSKFKLQNNMIQMGIAASGESTDSLELFPTAIYVDPSISAEIE